MNITPRENYLMMLNGEIPQYVPSIFERHTDMLFDELLTPPFAPGGEIYSVFGVKYVGSADNFYGAMPAPNFILLRDITQWRDIIRTPNLSGRDWQRYYSQLSRNFDRKNCALEISNGDFFQTLVSFMGFEGALLAMYEEPAEVYALLDYVCSFYEEVMKQSIYCLKPELFNLVDDDSAYRAPFFSVSLYRRLIKPFHKRLCDIALDAGMFIERHDCGKCQQFIDDWLEMGVCSWNPAQVTNDLGAIKKKYGNRLAICGGWDNQGQLGSAYISRDTLTEALDEYVSLLAPGGGFVFSPVLHTPPSDPKYAEAMDFFKDYYETNIRNYYNTHQY